MDVPGPSDCSGNVPAADASAVRVTSQRSAMPGTGGAIHGIPWVLGLGSGFLEHSQRRVHWSGIGEWTVTTHRSCVGHSGTEPSLCAEKSDILSRRSKVYGLPREDKVKMRKLWGGKSRMPCMALTTWCNAADGRIIERISPDSWCAVLKVITPVSVARAF